MSFCKFGKFASFFEHLEILKATLLLDFHLHDHVEDLYAQIRTNAIIRYTRPYISVRLDEMATAFKTSATGLEKELKLLIADHRIQARVDSQKIFLRMGYDNGSLIDDLLEEDFLILS